MTGGRTGGAAVTLADVARLAGVSLATASRALHGSGDRTVRPDLASRVLAAAAQLRYTPNASARAMVRGRTDVVGLVVHDVADPYFSSIADGVMRAAEAHGLVVTMASTRRDPAREIRYVATLRQQRVRGLILAGTRIRGAGDALATELEAYQAGGGRVAMISQRQLPVDTVVVANRAGASDLAAALVDRGYRRFAVLAGPRELITARDRYAGFRAGLTGRGVTVAEVCHSEFTRDGGYQGMLQLLDHGLPPSCVFAVNDVMAVGAMAALRDRGRAVPGEYAVAGFDDIPTLRDVAPGVTTVRIPLRELGERAIGFLLDEPADRPRVHRVRGEVVLRDSTPPVAR